MQVRWWPGPKTRWVLATPTHSSLPSMRPNLQLFTDCSKAKSSTTSLPQGAVSKLFCSLESDRLSLSWFYLALPLVQSIVSKTVVKSDI